MLLQMCVQLLLKLQGFDGLCLELGGSLVSGLLGFITLIECSIDVTVDAGNLLTARLELPFMYLMALLMVSIHIGFDIHKFHPHAHDQRGMLQGFLGLVFHLRERKHMK